MWAGLLSNRRIGATMELWLEMKLLEQSNLTRDGAWLDLVRTKQERLEKSSQKQKPKTEKKISKQRQLELENAAKKEHRRIILERRKERNLMRKMKGCSLTEKN